MDGKRVQELSSLRPLPELLSKPVPGVYLLFNELDQLLYVGQSLDMGKRIVQHRSKKEIPFCSARWLDIYCEDRGQLCAIERVLICAYHPPYNVFSSMGLKDYSDPHGLDRACELADSHFDNWTDSKYNEVRNIIDSITKRVNRVR